jgi:hypothetical protein
MWSLVKPKGFFWLYDKKLNEWYRPFQNKSCKICANKNCCNIIGNFLNGNKRQFCSEFRKEI